jgi:nitroimidazol reductase NimA-like FMN-containing flavoprotein (pyridoxamine 5'-phosphate oxidase superfamily)
VVDVSGPAGQAGLERMDRAECFALLEAEDVGRLAVVQGDMPAIFPVNYLLDGEDIVFRSAPGTKVVHGADAPAAFEIDHLDRAERRAWSIVATGHLEVVDPRDDAMARLRQLPIRPWAAGDKDIVMRLVVGTITGRVLGGPDEGA